MLWLLFAGVAALAYTFNTFFDNYMIDNYFTRRKSGGLMAFWFIGYTLALAVLLLTSGGFAIFGEISGLSSIAIMLFAGVLNILANIPYFKSLKYSNATELTILWQLGPVIALLLGVVLLDERLEPRQLLAFGLTLAATLYIVLGSRVKRERKASLTATFWVLITSVLWVLSDVFFVLGGREENFAGGFAWFLIGSLGAWAMLLATQQDWRKSASSFLREKRLRKLSLVTLNQAVYTVAEFAFRAAILIAPIALVTVFDQVAEVILVFIFGIILSRLWPKIGREKLKRRIIFRHLVAVVLVVISIILMQ